MSTILKRSVFCPACSSGSQRWGLTPSGTVRYRCVSCKKTFIGSQKRQGKRFSFLLLFEQYLLDGITYSTLSRWSHLSLSTLRRGFEMLLCEDPPKLISVQDPSDESYLILDGMWFGKKLCLMLYRESKNKLIIHYSFMKKEVGTKIAKDLKFIHSLGYHFTGVVSDGGTGIRKAVLTVYGNIPHQICMAHLHRLATNCLGGYPNEIPTQKLKLLADHIWKIESKEALRWWKEKLNSWIKIYWDFLYEKRKDTNGRWWYVHRGVRKALRTLITASEESFTFLSHPLMPRTSNKIEGSISNLTSKHLIHRGFKQDKTESFIRWFVYFYNRNLLSQRKTKED